MKKDKKKWLQLFYTRWGYKPVKAIKKEKQYSGTWPLDEILMRACDNNKQVLIHLVFPFANRFPTSKSSKDSIAIFPQAIFTEDGIFENGKPIFYDGSFYSLDGFISKCPELSCNAEAMFGTYTFSLEYFMLDDDFNIFKKIYLTPLKTIIKKTGIWNEARGKGEKRTEEEKERKNFIVKEFIKLKKKEPYPIEIIQDRWEEHLRTKYPDDNSKSDALIPSDMTVRRILDNYMKK